MQDWERTGIHANRVGQEAALQGDDRHQELVLGALRNPNISGHRDKENIVACSTQLNARTHLSENELSIITTTARTAPSGATAEAASLGGGPVHHVDDDLVVAQERRDERRVEPREPDGTDRLPRGVGKDTQQLPPALVEIARVAPA